MQYVVFFLIFQIEKERYLTVVSEFESEIVFYKNLYLASGCVINLGKVYSFTYSDIS